MKDSGIVTEAQVHCEDIKIELEPNNPDPADFEEDSPTSSNDSGISVKEEKDDLKSSKREDLGSNRSDDSLPSYSSLDGNEVSTDALLHSTALSKKSTKQKRRLHHVTNAIAGVKKFTEKHCAIIKKIAIVSFIFWNLCWLAFAMYRNMKKAVPFLVICSLVFLFKIYSIIYHAYGEDIAKLFRPCNACLRNNSSKLKWISITLFIALLLAWTLYDTITRPRQLISMAGYLIFLFLLFVSSKSPEDVRWRPVIWGLVIQLSLGLFILRTNVGFTIFNYIGNVTQEFLKFTDKGCAFVFGPSFRDHFFAFSVLPIIIFFSSFISIMYHLGAMQWLILKIAHLMQMSLGTSATESMVAAGNIFVGQTESPLLIRPYIKDLTTSELHAVMTCGFGTIAGSVLGAYLGFGIEAVYVITACVMAAPCALAVSKLVYPETEESKFLNTDSLVLESGGQRNIIEAAFVGASQAIPLVLNIGANLIAFLALLAAVNACLSWYGALVGIDNLSFELVCSYLFMPFSFLMGIEWADCFKCAELIGTKIFLNEFIAYEELAKMKANRTAENMTRLSENGDIQWISHRSEAIITYALCGFANVGSLGIQLGGLGAMCPERQSEMAKIIIRALVAGIFVSILNACVAGFLYYPEPPTCIEVLSGSWNITHETELHRCCSRLGSKNSTMEIFEPCCNHNWRLNFTYIEGC